MEDLTFDQALEAMHNGQMVSRRHLSWKYSFAFIRPSDSIPKSVIGNIKSLPESVRNHMATLDQDILFTTCLCKYFPNGTVLNGYVALSYDKSATDWYIYQPEQSSSNDQSTN